MIEVLEVINECKSPMLQGLLSITKTVLLLIEIIAPILLILSLTYNITGIMQSPDDSKKRIAKLKNSVIALVTIFFIPILINVVMGLVGEKTTFSDCWKNASFTNSKTYYQEDPNNKKKILSNPDDYEKGQKNNNNNNISGSSTGNENNSTGESGASANSTSDKINYDNATLNVEKAVNTNHNNPKSNLHDGRNVYRAVQSACYTGKYVVYSQNRNYGSIETSSKGGRICWSNLKTGEMVACCEIGKEGGHMDGLAYDNDRGYVLKRSGNKLLLFDEKTKKHAGYSKIKNSHIGLAYIPSIHMLVGYKGGKLIFYKFNNNNNTYEEQKTVKLQNFHSNAIQGMGTDGTNVFLADSSPYGGKRALYTYSLDGKKLEEHKMGKGFGSMSSEIESAFADNEGTLYLACPQGIARVKGYKANKIGLVDNS